MIHDISFTLSDDDLARGRLDKIILSRFPTSTRSLLNIAFTQNGVFADGTPCHKAFTPPRGCVITLPQLLEASDRDAVPQDGDLKLIWIDESLIAIDKPAGQPCHPVEPGETGTVSNIVAARFPEMIGIGGDPLMPGLVHRIDSGTSGLVLGARTQDSFDFIRSQFTNRSVKKIYTAEVHGRIDVAGGISGHLAHNSSFRGRMRCVSGAALPKGERSMFAETFYRPIAFHNGNTVLEVTIYTGVTHQIRCQLASIGHPIIGDATYGSDIALTGSYGLHHRLHATSIEFVHPTTRQTILIQSKPPFPID